MPEILRLRATSYPIDETSEERVQGLIHALEAAKRQGARSWELRSAIRLAKVWIAAGRPGAARKLLEPVFGAFTEGFERRDLTEASAPLEKLN